MVTIKKVKIKDGLFLDLEFEEKQSIDDINVTNSVTKSCKYAIHDDLASAFARLAIHLALICELIPESDYNSGQFREDQPYFDERLSSITVTGVSIGSEMEGVTITGYRRLRGGRVLNLTSPYTKFDDDSEEAYKFGSELSADVYAAVQETEEYLLHGKCKPSPQLVMEFEPGGEDGAEIGTKENPVKVKA